MRHSASTRVLGLLATAALALTAATVAIAGAPKEKPAVVRLEPLYMLEASGTILIAPDGTVSETKVLTEFDDAIRNQLASTISRFRFVPVTINGVAVAGRTGFHAVLVGKKQDGGLAVTMDSIDFRAPKGEKIDPVDNAMTPITGKHLSPPKYPTGPERSGVMGKVDVVIQVAADGTVADIGVVDSLIWNTGVSEPSARGALHELEVAALREARKWTFNVPADAAGRSAKDRTVGTSVAFVFELRNGVKLDTEGQWYPVLKAPKREVAWLQPEDSKRFAETALASGSLSGGSPYKLVTPVGGVAVF